MMSTKYKIQPSMEHWTCIIDMLGPAGRLEEAYEIVKSGVCNSDCRILLDCNAVWDALLNTYRMNTNTELGVIAAEKFSKLEPGNCGYHHSLMSNLYAFSKRWDEVTKILGEFWRMGSW